jgi:hypothetical protein
MFGGEIAPVREPPIDEWFMRNSEFVPDLLAERDFPAGTKFDARSAGHLPYGANFAVRAAEQKAVEYDPSLGVGASDALLGEKTDVLLRILRTFSGHGVWIGNASVQHLIPRERQTVEYIRKYYLSLGRTTACSDLKRSYAKPLLIADALRKSAVSIAQAALSSLIRHKEAKYISRRHFHFPG